MWMPPALQGFSSDFFYSVVLLSVVCQASGRGLRHGPVYSSKDRVHIGSESLMLEPRTGSPRPDIFLPHRSPVDLLAGRRLPFPS